MKNDNIDMTVDKVFIDDCVLRDLTSDRSVFDSYALPCILKSFMDSAFLTRLVYAWIKNDLEYINEGKFVMASFFLNDVMPNMKYIPRGKKRRVPIPRISKRFNTSVTNGCLYSKYFECVEKGYYINEGYNQKWYKFPKYVPTQRFLDLVDKVRFAQGHRVQVYDVNLVNKWKVTKVFRSPVEDGSKLYRKASFIRYNGKMYKNAFDAVRDDKGVLAKKKTKIGVGMDEVRELVRDVKKVGQRFERAYPLNNITFFMDCMVSEATYEEYMNTMYKKNNIDYSESVFEHTTKLDMEVVDNCDTKNMDWKGCCHLQRIKEQVTGGGELKLHYKQSTYGRYYAIGNPLQYMPSAFRKAVLKDYTEVDISASVYSVMWNIASSEGYDTENMKFFSKFMESPNGFREGIRQELAKYDEEVTRDYVKTLLTAIMFGARISESSLMFGHGSIAEYIDGYSDRYTPYRAVSNNNISGVYQEVRGFMSWYIEKHKTKKEDGYYLPNVFGQELPLKRHISMGQRIAHIYQSIESVIMRKMCEIPCENGQSLLENSGVGLCVHDAVYVKTDMFDFLQEKGMSISEYFQNWIYDELGYSLKFTQE